MTRGSDYIYNCYSTDTAFSRVTSTTDRRYSFLTCVQQICCRERDPLVDLVWGEFVVKSRRVRVDKRTKTKTNWRLTGVCPR